MNGHTQTATQVLVTGLEHDLMLPSHPEPSTSKRKADEGNPLIAAAKKLKTSKSSNKRKHPGEEQPGGLFIVRATTRSPPRDTHAIHVETHPSFRPSPAPSTTRAANGDVPKPPPKKTKTDAAGSHPVPSRVKERDKPPNSRTESEVDDDLRQNEDVRQMQSETDTLRQRSRPPGALNPAFLFPPPNGTATTKPHKLSAQQNATQSRGRIRELSQPVPLQETPQIHKNKLMRGEAVRGHTRRKSSLTRGKRISSAFENTGVIVSGHAHNGSDSAQPHTSVRDSSFYKHIDIDVPEPQRAQQLLIWCSHRAMNELVEHNTLKAVGGSSEASSSSNAKGKDAGKDPPPLSSADMMLLKGVGDSVVRMLAEKKIDTNVFSPSEGSEAPRQLKENEENVRNRAREAKFNAHIQKLKQEDEAWSEVGNSYNTFRANVLAELEERRKEFPSGKAKGKQRSTEENISLWDISETDLPEHFRGSDGLELAKGLVKPEKEKQSMLTQRMADLEYTADRLHALVHSTLKTTRIAGTDLDRRYALLNTFLAARSHSLIPSTAPASGSLSFYLPTTVARPPPTTDPQDLLRAMSRIDLTRPQAQVGDAARRAVREVRRATDAFGGMAERKLTDVPPPTPRKPPGTPRRATTPGRGR